jgi:hypothetical protein
LPPRPPHSNGLVRLVTGHTVATCLVGSQFNCAAHSRKSRTLANQPDFLLPKLAADRAASELATNGRFLKASVINVAL